MLEAQSHIRHDFKRDILKCPVLKIKVKAVLLQLTAPCKRSIMSDNQRVSCLLGVTLSENKRMISLAIGPNVIAVTR